MDATPLSSSVSVDGIVTARRGRGRSTPRLALYGVSAGAMTAFSLPLAAMPAQAAAMGHDLASSSFLATVFLAGIVAGELGAAAFIARTGTRVAILVGLVLLGAPSLVVAASAEFGVWVACGAVRGLGFALVVIAAAAIAAASAADGKLGAELGWYGVAAGVPSIVALPLGLHLGEIAGFWAVHVLAASAALGALAAAAALPARRDRAPESAAATDAALRRGRRSARAGILTMSRSPRAIVHAAALAAGAATNGLFVVFVPLAGPAGGTAVVALLALAFGAPAGRVVAGRFGDRIGPRALLAPALVLCGGGLALSAVTAVPAVFVLGACAAGFGFGVLQNATLQALCEGRPGGELAAASALWNLAYDLGLAIGTLGFGLLGGLMAPTVAAAIAGVALPLAVGAWAVSGGRRSRSARAGSYDRTADAATAAGVRNTAETPTA
jgi:MFS family permease